MVYLCPIFSGVLYGPLFYRHLENDNTTALRESKGNYSAYMTLSEESLQELQWWCDNKENVDYKICIPNTKIDTTLYTDASNDGWGAVMGTLKTGGRWNEAEAPHHINYRESMAIFLGLKAFCSREDSVHIQVSSDNTTAVHTPWDVILLLRQFGYFAWKERHGYLQRFRLKAPDPVKARVIP